MASRVLAERYVIQKQLSQNAGRRTFLAKDLQTQKWVVVKILIFGADFQWSDLKLFEREAKTLQKLSHPAIPHYLDYFDVDTSRGKGFALVQSYISAKSLEQWLKSGRTFSEAEVTQLAKDLLEILRYLHGQQPPVIHRDIKPSNILLENRSGNCIGQIYLVDFGSVQTLAAAQGSTITVVGTYGYMPPEQFGGRTVPASDIYSLGATLIYLVTGRHPAELSQDNLRIQVDSAVNLSPNLLDWLEWMTEPSLNRRLGSAEEALNAWENPRSRIEIFPIARKIAGSRIQMKTDGETVEILIPPAQFNWKTIASIMNRDLVSMIMFFVIGLFLNFFGFLLALAQLKLKSLMGLIVILFCPGIFIVLWFACLYSIIREYFLLCTRVHLDRKQIYWTDECFSNKIRQGSILKKKLKKIIYIPGYCKMTQGKKGGAKTIFIPAKITLVYTPENPWDSSIYEFSLDRLTEPEMEWFANELSRWSGVPLSDYLD